MEPRARHPWVKEFAGRVGFALQAVAVHSHGDQGAALIRAGQHAERYGYDAFFLGDHPSWAPECWLHLAVIAAQTRRVRVGQMVAAVPYRNPLLTARLQSDLDRISDGRSVLGLGIGWNAAVYGLGTNEFDRMGLTILPVKERQEALEEALTEIRGVWGAELFSFVGKHYSLENGQVDPPLQESGPPVVIAGAGHRTLGQVVRLADACNFGPGPAGHVDTPEDARQWLAVLQSHCDGAGRPYDDILRSHFSHWVMLAPTEAALARKKERYFPQGLDEFWGQYLVAETPEAVSEVFGGFMAAGIQYFVVQTLDPDDEETISLVTGDVAPQL